MPPHNGSAATLARIEEASDLVLEQDGWLYVAGVEAVYRVSKEGDVELFACGFGQGRGLAFDSAGNLFVADDAGNSVVRINGFPQSVLTGVVTDSVTGTLVDGVRVRVMQAQPPYAGQIIVTSKDSPLRLPIAPGTYQVIAWADGYHPAVETSVTIGDEMQKVTMSLSPVE